MIDDPATAIALAVGIGVTCQIAAHRLRVPSIILLLGAGLAVGPLLDLVRPDAVFGDLLFPAVSAAVGLLLFEGGLSLRWPEVGGLRVTLVRLLTIGVATAAATSWFAASVVGRLPVGPALLFAVIMVVTGPTVIIPLLRHARLRPEVARLLRWEGIFVDPIGAVLAVALFEVVILGEGGTVGDAAYAVAATTSVGVAIGGTAALGLTLLLRSTRVPDHLENAVAFATVMGTLAVANAIFDEAGLVATTVLGFGLAAQRQVRIRTIAEFHESLAVLLVPVMFVLLAARVSADDLTRNLLPATGVLAFLVVVARPLSIFVSTVGSKVSRRGRVYLAGMAPRGIVAASVSALFGLRLEEHGIDGGRDLAAVTFLVVAGTVIVYGLAAVPLARRLRVDVPEPTGIVLVGAPRWVADLGETLVDQGVPVLVVACDEEDADRAVSSGLLVYSGRLQSDDLDEAVKAIGARLALVASPREEVAAFAADRLGRLLGQTNVYVVPTDEADHQARFARPADHWGRVAFGGRLTLESASTMINDGHAVSVVEPTASQSLEGCCVLLRVDSRGAPSIADGEPQVPELLDGCHVVLARTTRAVPGTTRRSPLKGRASLSKRRPGNLR